MLSFLFHALSLALDPNWPDTNETNYRFSCEGSQITLRFAEEFRSSGELPLADRRRIRLLELSASGRRIAASQVSAARQALHRYAWLTRVQGRCGDSGSINIWIEGMPAQEWADYVERRAHLRNEPRPASSNEFAIDARGELTIH